MYCYYFYYERTSLELTFLSRNDPIFLILLTGKLLEQVACSCYVHFLIYVLFLSYTDEVYISKLQIPYCSQQWFPYCQIQQIILHSFLNTTSLWLWHQQYTFRDSYFLLFIFTIHSWNIVLIFLFLIGNFFLMSLAGSFTPSRSLIP